MSWNYLTFANTLREDYFSENKTAPERLGCVRRRIADLENSLAVERGKERRLMEAIAYFEATKSGTAA